MRKRGSIFQWLLVALAGVLLVRNAGAQEGADARETKVAQAEVRIFSDLGERLGPETFSLTCRMRTARGESSGTLFAKSNGGRSSNIGGNAMYLPAGEYAFTLQKDGGGDRVNAGATLAANGVYTILATLDEARRLRLRVVREDPHSDDPAIPPVEKPGVVFHNLRHEVSLTALIGEAGRVPVPFSREESFFLPANEISGELRAEFPSPRKRNRRQAIPYESGVRMVVVFFRNSFGRESTFSFSPKPNPMTTTSETLEVEDE